MNTLSIISILFGVIYFISSIIFRNSVNIYIAPSNEYCIKEDIYIKLQLIAATINSFILIVGGLCIGNYKYILLLPITFTLINLGIFYFSKRKGYISKYVE